VILEEERRGSESLPRRMNVTKVKDRVDAFSALRHCVSSHRVNLGLTNAENPGSENHLKKTFLPYTERNLP
jgi:hypothetical protein